MADPDESHSSLSGVKDDRLPPHLAAALGKAHAKEDVPIIVAALEAHGWQVKVVRLQLGLMRRKGWGETKVVYQTRGKADEEEKLK